MSSGSLAGFQSRGILLPMSNFTSNARIVRVDRHWQASNAVVCGDVTIGDDCSFWFGVVVRGDVAAIRIGRRVNLQEHVVLHCDSGVDLEIGDEVTVGHGAIIHGRRVGHRTLVAMNAVILGGAVIGDDCIVAAGCVVSPGTQVPDGHVIMGVPGKVVRPVRPEEIESMRHNNRHYVELAGRHVMEPETFYR
jgi:carbonic anhydrase/acetyltransferase-like protein (isoleucine patch superfamily)